MKTQLQTSIFLILLMLLLAACGGGEDDPVIDCSSLMGVVSNKSDAACSDANGSITATGSGGTEPYTYQINGGPVQNLGNFSGLAAGNYTITVKDKNNCTKDITATIANTGITLAATVASEAGCGTANGSVTATATGNGNIMYQLDDGAFQPSNIFETLQRGNYTITAKDAEGCSTSTDVSIKSGISFSNQVSSIIQTNCAISGCLGNMQPPLLTSFSAIQANAANIKTRTGNGSMPPAGKTPLTDDEKQKIACWVDDGAVNN